MLKRVALISEHASPLVPAGSVDSGGQNIYVAQVAAHLLRLGWHVDVFTRADSRSLPRTVDCENGVRVIHVPAGRPEYIRKEELLPYMGEFARYMIQYSRSNGHYD